jgi:hypothetical protein
MQPRNRIINYTITFAFGVIALGAGVLGLGQSFYWCYEVLSGAKQFVLSTCIGLFVISILMLGIGYGIIKYSQKA